jgi:uracil-DNA glycosylase family 4
MNNGFFTSSETTTRPQVSRLPQCGACGGHKHCNSPKLRHGGLGDAGILVVRSAPTWADERNGCFQPDSQLGSMFQQCGLDLERDCWISGAVICRPKDDKQPKEDVISYCRPNIKNLVAELKPKVIIPMGQAAIASVMGLIWNKDLNDEALWTGWRIPSQELGCWVCPTYSMDRALADKDPNILRWVREHLGKAAGCAALECPKNSLQGCTRHDLLLNPVEGGVRVENVLRRSKGAVSFDYETNCLKPDSPEARIASCAVCWGREEPEDCFAFPWFGDAIPAMRELLQSPIPKIASNLKFEDRWTRKEFGFRVRAWAWDTMLAAHVLDNRPGITSVKFQAFVRLGQPAWNDKVDPYIKSGKGEKFNRVFDCGIKDLLHYNALDASLEFEVAVNQIKEMGCEMPWEI